MEPVLIAKAWSASARASSLEARRRKRAAKLASLEKVSKVNYDECKPLPQREVELMGGNAGLVRASESAWNKLTAQDQSQVRDYTDVGYYQLNQKLVKRAEEGSDAPLGDLGTRAMVKRMDKATSLNSLKEGLVVYRGVKSGDSIFSTVSTASVGDEFIDPKVLSTSLEQRVALGFAGNRGILLEIRAPKGSKALPVDAFDRTSNYGEREVIFPRDRVFEVAKIYEKEVNDKGQKRVVKVVTLNVLNYDLGPVPITGK